MTEISQYPTLREDQRIAARHQARENLIAKLGGEPQFSTYERRQFSRYSPGVEAFMYRAMWALLIAAFSLSAIHIFYAARRSYGEGIANPTLQIIAGLMFVAVAEIAAILFSTAPAVYDQSMPAHMKKLSYAASLVAGLVAIVGNVTVSIAYQGSAFNWVWAWIKSTSSDPMLFLVASVPPVFVLIVGQLQKVRILAQNERRYAATVDYEKAIAEWRVTLDRLEIHPDWRNTYAWALWDTWRKGKRREIIAQITQEDRQAIILREMSADRFFEEPAFHSGVPFRRSNGTREGGTKNKAEQIADIIRQNPDLLDLHRTEAADQLGVSIGSLQRGIDLYRENGHNSAEDRN